MIRNHGLRLLPGVLFMVTVLAACKPEAPEIPAPPLAVKSNIQALDVVFTGVQGDPNAFRREAEGILPRLRESMERWALEVNNQGARRVIRGWALEVGTLETRVGSMPEEITAEDCEPIVRGWRSLRSRLP